MRIDAIISGGQSGVDRAAMDSARAVGLDVAGWCPAGRRAEDGRIDEAYSLRETPSRDPAQRTAWNVFDSSATLVLTSSEPMGGVAHALEVAERFRRPLLRVAPDSPQLDTVRGWLLDLGAEAPPLLLNVAGPRESEEPGIYRRARTFLDELLGGSAGSPRHPGRVALVTGGAGLLGTNVVRLAPPGWVVHWTYRRGRIETDRAHWIELSDPSALRELMAGLRPELVVHTAYGDRVPERDIAAATVNVVEECRRWGAHLVHLSSDMVLAGDRAPYDEGAALAPVNEYGRWKARVEDHVRQRLPAAAIVRCSLITSFEPLDPRTRWIRSGLTGDGVARLFTDELRSPILATDLARQVWEISRLDPDTRCGVWNLAGPEALSRYALGLIAAAALGLDASRLVAGSSNESAEIRPRDLRLLTARADRELLTRARPLSEAAAQHRNQHPATDSE